MKVQRLTALVLGPMHFIMALDDKTAEQLAIADPPEEFPTFCQRQNFLAVYFLIGPRDCAEESRTPGSRLEDLHSPGNVISIQLLYPTAHQCGMRGKGERSAVHGRSVAMLLELGLNAICIRRMLTG
jgi:hypothetical protein